MFAARTDRENFLADTINLQDKASHVQNLPSYPITVATTAG